MTIRRQRVEWVVAADRSHLHELAANVILDVLRNTERPVFGFATGGTPLGLYEQLVRRSLENPRLLTRWQDVTGFNLDEYVGLSPEHPQSYHHYMWRYVYRYLPVRPDRMFIPKGIGNLEDNCRSYDESLMKYGWPDVQILGIGKNGHIGFNEPARRLAMNTHVTRLSESTRLANARFFPSARDVPEQAITMGMAGILRAKQIVLLAFGEAKRDALIRAFSGWLGTDVPASLLQLHPHVTVFTDQDIFGDLS
ncbi:glucosamine-6-phosphate deaminase [Alicyclobacillus contaminans]|uniref:glucosamine-6-phosphate deaminase n=1 Tax=Alicyclobacillus contaminans TaxID=392016 RepID=UPI001FE1B4F0|nr:glucosamine-6-phosphate deaminase [Alicyclobacillus contaminans]